MEIDKQATANAWRDPNWDGKPVYKDSGENKTPDTASAQVSAKKVQAQVSNKGRGHESYTRNSYLATHQPLSFKELSDAAYWNSTKGRGHASTARNAYLTSTPASRALEAGLGKYGSTMEWFNNIKSERNKARTALFSLNDEKKTRDTLNRAKATWAAENWSRDEVEEDDLDERITAAERALQMAEEEYGYAKYYNDLELDSAWEQNLRDQGISWGNAYTSTYQAQAGLQRQIDNVYAELQSAQRENKNAGVFGAGMREEASAARVAELEETYDRLLDQMEMVGRRNQYALDMMTKDAQAVERGQLRGDFLLEQDERTQQQGKADFIENYTKGNTMGGVWDALRSDRSDFMPTNAWSQEQLLEYQTLLGYGYEDRAREYAAATNKSINDAKMKEAIAPKYEWGYGADATGVGRALRTAAGTVATVATAPERLASYLNKVQDVYTTGVYTGEDRAQLHDYAEAVASGRAQAMNDRHGTIDGKGWGDLYQAINSVAQSMVYGNALGKAGTLAIFFGQAADSGFDEAIARGATGEQAALSGLLSGAAEVIAEKMPLDNLLATDKAAARGLAKSILKQAGIEGAEEGITSLMNTFADKLVMGDKSALDQQIKELMAEGMSYEDARAKTMRDYANSVAWDVVIGAVSGGVSSGVQYGVDAISPYTDRYGADARTLVDEARQIKDRSDTLRKAEKKVSKGKSISNATAKKLVTTVNRSRMVDAVEKQINTRSPEMEQKTARSLANAVVAKSRNERLTDNWQKLISKNSELVSEIEKDMNDTKPADWVKAIGVRGAEAAVYGDRNVINARQQREETLLNTGEYAEAKAANIEDGQDVQEYSDDFDVVAEVFGNSNNFQSFDEVWNSIKADTILTEAQARNAWETGKARLAKMDMTSKLTRRGTGKLSFEAVSDGGVQYEAPSAEETETFKRSARYQYLEALAENIGVDIVFFKGGTDGINGKYQNGTVYLAIDASPTKYDTVDGYVMLTAAHELTHYIREASPARYAELKDFVTKHLIEQGKLENGKTLTALIAAKRRAYADAGVELSVDAAVEEVIADACELVLKDNDLVVQLNKERPSVYNNIRFFLKRFMAKVKAAFAGLEATHAEAKGMTDSFEELQRIWNLGLSEAAENRKPKTVAEKRAALERKFAAFNRMVDEESQNPEALDYLNEEADTLNAEEAEIRALELEEQRAQAGEVSEDYGKDANHIDNRTPGSVASRDVKAFQYDHPQLHEYFAEAARQLADEVQAAQMQDSVQRGKKGGVTYHGPVAQLVDMGLTKPRALQCLEDIINDKGAENYADAKRVEIVLNDMLSNGWRDMSRRNHKANAEYIAAKEEVAGGRDSDSWDAYLEDHMLSLLDGLTTEEELRREWEAGQTIGRYSVKDNGNFTKDKYFDRQIDQWESKADGTRIKVGELHEGSALNRVGFPATGMWFDVGKIKTSFGKHEDHLTKAILKNIPDLLSNPIAITEYRGPGNDIDNTVNVFGLLMPNKNTPIVVGVMMTKGRDGQTIINKVRTVHARGNADINDDNILYLNEDKKRTRNWFQVCGNSVPLEGTKFGFIRSISYVDKKSNGKLSLKDDAIAAWTQARDIMQQRNDLQRRLEEFKTTDEYNTVTDKFFQAVMSGENQETAFTEYREWEERSGYAQMTADIKRLDEEYNRLFDEYARLNNEAEQEEKNVAIAKSGLDEDAYYQKQAVKEFGYTPYFYDAGYIVPNGKMLNFSGEKGKHYGMRGEDHRAIGTIYPSNISGSEAMLKFMGAGNVRIMAETPGIDIAVGIEPTKEQYSTIGKFVNDSISNRYFSVDFTDSKGITVANLEYEGSFSATKVKADIKHYFETGEIRKQSTVQRFMYSIKDEAQSDRMLLANTLMTAAQNDGERRRLNNYKAQIDVFADIQQQLADAEDELSRAYRTGDKQAIAKAQRERNALTEKLIRADKKLLELQATKPLKELMARVKQDTRRHTQRLSYERRNKKELRDKIKKLHKDMTAQLLKPKENKYVPTPLLKTVAELLDEINLDSGRSEKIKAKMTELSGQYQAIAKSNEYGYAFDNEVAGMIAQLQSVIAEKDDTSIYHMSKAELEMVYNTMEAINHTVRESVKLIGVEENRNIFELAKAMISETRKANPVRVKLGNDYITLHLRPDVFFKRMGGYVKNSVWQFMGDMLNDAQRKQTQLQMEGAAIFEELINKDEELKAMTNPKRLIDIGLKDSNGNSVPVTMGIALKIYMDTMAEDNARHMMYSGYTVPNIRDYYKDNTSSGFGIGTVRVNGFGPLLTDLEHQLRSAETEAEQNEIKQKIEQAEADAATWVETLRQNIYEQMGEYELEWVRAAEKFFNQFSQRVLNETTLAVYGFEKATVPYYVPIHTDAAYRQANFESISRDMSLENSGFMKARVPAKNPMLAEDLVDVVSRQIDNVAKYAAMMPAIRNFQKVYGKSTSGFDSSVQAEVRSKFDDTAIDYIENIITDLTSPRRSANKKLGALYDKMRGNVAKAALTLNVGSALEQMSSYPKAAAVVGYKPLLKAMQDIKDNPMRSEEARQEIAKWTPLMWYRMQGYFDRDFSDLRKDNKMVGKVESKLGFMLNWLETVEGSTVGQMWYAAQYYVEDTTDLERGTDEFMQETAKVFNRIVEQTQANYTMFQRPDILRSPDRMTKSLTMFMTERLQNANMVLDAVGTYNAYARDYRNGVSDVTEDDVKQAKLAVARTGSSLIASSVMSVMFKALGGVLTYNMLGFRDEDDELTPESVMEQLVINFFSSIAGTFLLGNELFSMVASLALKEPYYGVSVGGVDLLENAVNSILNAIKDIPDMIENGADGKIIWKACKALLQLFGIPANNTEKLVRAITYRAKDIQEGNGFWEFASEVKMTDERRAKLMYKANINEDVEKLEKLVQHYKTEADADAALAKHIKTMYQNDELNAEEAQAQLEDYASMSEYDAKLAIDKLRFEKEHGFDYEDMKQQYLAGTITDKNAVEYKVEYGDEKQTAAEGDVNKWRMEKDTGLAYSKISSYLASGDINETTAAKYLMDYGGYDSLEAAEKKVSEWMGEIETGIPADQVEDYYADGLIDRDFLVNYYMNYKWLYDEELANQVADKRDFVGKDERMNSITTPAVAAYNEYLPDAGIDKYFYYTAWKERNAIQSGEEINGKWYARDTLRLLQIDTYNLQPWQKTLLAQAFDISDKNIRRYAPWN